MEVDSPEADGTSSEVEQTAQSAGFDRRPDLTNRVVSPTGRRDDAGNSCAGGSRGLENTRNAGRGAHRAPGAQSPS